MCDAAVRGDGHRHRLVPLRVDSAVTMRCGGRPDRSRREPDAKSMRRSTSRFVGAACSCAAASGRVRKPSSTAVCHTARMRQDFERDRRICHPTPRTSSTYAGVAGTEVAVILSSSRRAVSELSFRSRTQAGGLQRTGPAIWRRRTQPRPGALLTATPWPERRPRCLTRCARGHAIIELATAARRRWKPPRVRSSRTPVTAPMLGGPSSSPASVRVGAASSFRESYMDDSSPASESSRRASDRAAGGPSSVPRARSPEPPADHRRGFLTKAAAVVRR